MNASESPNAGEGGADSGQPATPPGTAPLPQGEGEVRLSRVDMTAGVTCRAPRPIPTQQLCGGPRLPAAPHAVDQSQQEGMH